MKEAFFYTAENSVITCELCPLNCKLNVGQSGKCGVRLNASNKLYSKSYGLLSKLEIKPSQGLFSHQNNNEKTIAIGSFGCNTKCFYCNNCGISHHSDNNEYEEYSTDNIIKKALENNCTLIYHGYNEPLINFEFVQELSIKASSHNLKTVISSNGFINRLPLDDIIPHVYKFIIDIKAFDDLFYRNYTQAVLSPILSNLKRIRKADISLEINHLIIPQLNETPEHFENMCQWIKNNLGAETPLNLPQFKTVKNISLPNQSISNLTIYKQIAEKHLRNVEILME